jgi:imidazolonepropionase-like amidohydrolase
VSGEYLVADSIWWDGRLHHSVALHEGSVRPLPAGAQPRRFPGTLLPGLTDAHVHAGLADMATVRAGGIAGVWDLGGSPPFLRRLLSAGSLPLPRMIIAGQFLTAPGGYPSGRAWAPPDSCRFVRSASDAADAVAEQAALGASLIKVTAHAGGPTLPAPVLVAVVDAAQARRLPVVVHAEGPGTVAAAVSAGADLLAHTPWTEDLDDGLLRSAVSQDMRWISTLDIHGWGSETPEVGTAVGNLRRFLGYGGSVVYGTDLGNGPLVPGVNPREIRLLQRAGLTPDQILTAMTSESAGLPPSWIPGGLDLSPAVFADVLATARVLGPGTRPGHHERQPQKW